jgi:uncharacterized membrane protein
MKLNPIQSAPAATGAASTPLKPKSFIPKSEWFVPAGLLLLSLVPVIAGAARVVELTGGAEVTASNARFFGSPVPVIIHIFSATIFCMLGAFQFAPSLRRSGNRWHRMAGRILVPCGLAAALSGLWMSQFYQLPPTDGVLLYWMRLVFGTTMVFSLLFGFVLIRRRDFNGHGAWMMRGYAIGMGAGTQVFTHVFWMLVFGVPDEFTRALLMGAGWVINLAVAEWVIRTRLARPARRPSFVPHDI